MPQEEKVWVTFEREFNGVACPVFLGDCPVNFKSGKSRPMKVLAGKHYLLQCELIGPEGTKLKIKETFEGGAPRTIINSTIPEDDHEWKVCNGSVCRYLVLATEIPGGVEQ